jgi:hypothetical protein
MDLSEFESMWTTEKNDYLLVTSEEDNLCVIMRVSHAERTIWDVIIEKDECYFAVIEHMKAAGVKVVDVDYIQHLTNRFSNTLSSTQSDFSQ